MKKFLVYLLIIVLAVLGASLFGILHDQISYTVSPEYFTRFKFEQFGLIDAPLSERVRASIVGFLASWWMGVPIGVLVGAAGFIHGGARRMLRVSLWSLLVVIVFTLLFGLGGLAYGYSQTSQIDLKEYQGWYIPEGVVDLRRYLCVGYMHNASYLGGAMAIFVAWIFHVIFRFRASGSIGTVQEQPGV